MASTEFNYQDVVGKIQELQAALDERLPGFPLLLRDIHNTLRQDPEVTTLLTDEEISVIVKGLETHAAVTIVDSKAKKASSRGGSKKVAITADML